MKPNNRRHSSSPVQRTQQQIKALLEMYHSTTGITIKQFCEQHSIAEGTFYGWHKRYRHELRATGSDSHSAFIPLRLNPASQVQPSPSALFAQVGAISIYQPVEADYLKNLLP